MTRDKAVQLISAIDKKYVDEVLTFSQEKAAHKPHRFKWAVAAACIIMLLIGGSAAFVLLHNRTIYGTLSSDRLKLASSYAQLKNVSDLIVLARPKGEKENILITAPNDKNLIINGYTITNLEVVEVYKGQLSDNVIKITEEYYIVKDASGTYIWSQEDYYPANEDELYVFFLKEYDRESKYAGMYFPVDLQNGKYVTSVSALGKEYKKLELKDGSSLSEYYDYYKEVFAEYISK